MRKTRIIKIEYDVTELVSHIKVTDEFKKVIYYQGKKVEVKNDTLIIDNRSVQFPVTLDLQLIEEKKEVQSQQRPSFEESCKKLLELEYEINKGLPSPGIPPRISLDLKTSSHYGILRGGDMEKWANAINLYCSLFETVKLSKNAISATLLSIICTSELILKSNFFTFLCLNFHDQSLKEDFQFSALKALLELVQRDNTLKDFLVEDIIIRETHLKQDEEIQSLIMSINLQLKKNKTEIEPSLSTSLSQGLPATIWRQSAAASSINISSSLSPGK